MALSTRLTTADIAPVWTDSNYEAACIILYGRPSALISWPTGATGHATGVAGGAQHQMVRDEVAAFEKVVNCDWDELTAEQKAVAELLGNKKKSWDAHEETGLEQKNWSELTSAQQQAAQTLGHSEASWDAEQDDENGA